MSSEAMLFSFTFAALLEPIFVHYLVIYFLLCEEILEIWLAGCPCFFCVSFFLPFDHLLLTKQSTWVHFVDRMCYFLKVIPVDSDFSNRPCSLCNFVRYMSISSSGFHRNSVSCNFYFLSVYFNDRHFSCDGQASLLLSCALSWSFRPWLFLAIICRRLWGFPPFTRLQFQNKLHVHPILIFTMPPSMIFLMLLLMFWSGVTGFSLGWFLELPGGVQCRNSLLILPSYHYWCRISKFCSFKGRCVHCLDGVSNLGQFVSCLLYQCLGCPTHHFGGGFTRSYLMF